MSSFPEIGIFLRKLFCIQSQFFDLPRYWGCTTLNSVLSVTMKTLQIAGFFVSFPFILRLNHKNTAFSYEKINLPTTLTGFLCGSNPNVYWKIPRPWKRTGANATFFWILSWMSLSLDPRGLLTWLKRSFSPKANTGTREALKMENINRNSKLYSF